MADRLRPSSGTRAVERVHSLASVNMAIENHLMDISVTEFKHRCLEIIRRVEESGKPVAITRRGKVVARLSPSASSVGPSRLKPWEQLRALGGRLRATPSESVLRDDDFEALR